MKEKPAMTYAEIAQATGIGEKTIRRIEREALEKIRDIFRKRGLLAKNIL
jgi:DNA-directed RNA polymerase sigma subunit (sigma70/sigma32)